MRLNQFLKVEAPDDTYLYDLVKGEDFRKNVSRLPAVKNDTMLAEMVSALSKIKVIFRPQSIC